MRHNLSGRKLGRKSSHRLAMLKNMAASLIEHGRIKTTLHKAKELRRLADNLVTLGKTDSVFSRRKAFGILRNKVAVHKLFKEIAPSFQARQGGYTRIYHLGCRAGDAAKMALIEYLSNDLLAAKVEGKVVVDKAKTDKKSAKATAKKKAEKKVSAKQKIEQKKATSNTTHAKAAPAAKKPQIKRTQGK